MKRLCLFIACVFVLCPAFSASELVDIAEPTETKEQSKETNKDDKSVITDIEIQEFVNVTTKFEFSSRDNPEKITKIYGALEPSKVNYEMPVYDAKDEVCLNLSFTPSVLKAFEKKLMPSKRQLKKLEIPVQIEIADAGSVNVEDSSGISEIKVNSSDNSSKISFTIKNDDSANHSVKLLIKSSRLEKNDKSKSCQVFVNYRNENNKIVDKTCEVFQTITFKKNK